MKRTIDITEEDIYQFVNYTQTLSAEKKDYIESHPAEFEQQIEFYRGIQKPLTENEMADLIEKSFRILPDEGFAYRLTPTFIENKHKDQTVRLAAASLTLKKNPVSVSFADKECKYLIRIINDENKTLIYVFPNNDKTSKIKYELTLFPSGEKHIIADISMPYKLEPGMEINMIDLIEHQG